jgi:hypothetical protein
MSTVGRATPLLTGSRRCEQRWLLAMLGLLVIPLVPITTRLRHVVAVLSSDRLPVIVPQAPWRSLLGGGLGGP